MNPMWMIVASLAAVVALGVIVAVHRVFVRRRAQSRPSPALCATDEHVSQPLAANREPSSQVLSRDSLLRPNRTLNVHGWDNTPDSGAEIELNGITDADVDSDPYLIDRAFLARRGRKE